jgi:hypothetical protein
VGLVCRSIVLGFEVFAASEEKKRKEKTYKQMLLLKK